MPNAITDNLIRTCVFFCFMASWQAVAVFYQPAMLPSPWQVVIQLIGNVQQGELLSHLFVTLYRVAISFTVAIVLGFIIGCLMGRFRLLDLALDFIVQLALNIPALVVIILCFVWFGLNDAVAILAVVVNKMPMVIVACREGVRSLDKKLFEVAQVYRLSAAKTFYHVFLPQMMPYLTTVIRNGLALIWKIVLVVELIGCSDGIGFQLGIFFQFFDITNILAYTFAFILIIFAIEILLVQTWERKASAWRYV